MTCLIERALSGTRIKLHTSMLGTFFVYTLGLSMPIFKKKSLQRFLGKSSKLWVLHKNDFLCNTQSLELFPRNLRKDFFLKIGILSPKVYTKNVPNIEVCDFIPGPSTASPIKQVIVVLYLQGGYIYAPVCMYRIKGLRLGRGQGYSVRLLNFNRRSGQSRAISNILITVKSIANRRLVSRIEN